MSENCTEGASCSSCSGSDSCSAEEKQKQEERVLQSRLSNINHRIAVMSGKGGVGKSFVAAGLASSLARRGYDTVIIDLDLGGANVHTLLGIKHPETGGKLKNSP